MTTAGEHAPDTPSGSPRYRILLIEDDLGDALLVEELLHDTGLSFELTTRTSQAEARTELASSRADRILLDLHLPDLSGIAALTAVRTPPTTGDGPSPVRRGPFPYAARQRWQPGSPRTPPRHTPVRAASGRG
ncbi:hypothetical protein Smic_77060 [Streptomyces microflavus]|uniref:Response regulatory domain-containing protein n=1 Tax=Streptomyces microflavus TaxID=1919 RepID=A0A7J0D334_STRMI|nr:hypothetical protein Smic_77060 [Streptomyces microflavus]